MIKNNDKCPKPIQSNLKAPFYANMFPTTDLNGKYGRIVGTDGLIPQKFLKLQHEDLLFRTQSQEKLNNEPLNEANSNGSFLFITGSSAPICTVKEKRINPKPFKAPLPKTKRLPTDGQDGKDYVLPLQGFGCTNNKAKSVSNAKDVPQSTTNLPAINSKTIIEEEKDKGPTNRFIIKRGISQVTRRQIQVNRSLNDQKQKKRGFTINTYPSRSELETLQLVIQKNDWQEGVVPMEGNLVWFGLPLRECDMKQLQKRPKMIFNKYPGSEYLCRKKTLSVIISRMKRYFPEEYNFMPKEYVIPEEQEELEKYIKKHPASWMIAKPSRGRGGEGIFLFKGQFNPPYGQTEFVVQKYISKPLLVEGKKFDIRLYVLITGLDPVECYFCNEGMVRFCTENYKRPTKDNSKELCKHLTNFCINKESENYINPQEYGEENKGSKRLFSIFFQQLEKDSEFDNEKVKSEIISTVKKTIISLTPYLRGSAKKWINPELGKIKCFQIIGIDILLDQNNKAWLMEINANPSMNMFLEKINTEGEYERTLSELDKYLKCLVIEDAIKIVKSKKPCDDLGIYQKILPSDNDQESTTTPFATLS